MSKTVHESIIDVKNWLNILTMDSEHNDRLEKFQAEVTKEFIEFIKTCDPFSLVMILVRLKEGANLYYNHNVPFKELKHE